MHVRLLLYTYFSMFHMNYVQIFLFIVHLSLSNEKSNPVPRVYYFTMIFNGMLLMFDYLLTITFKANFCLFTRFIQRFHTRD